MKTSTFGSLAVLCLILSCAPVDPLDPLLDPGVVLNFDPENYVVSFSIDPPKENQLRSIGFLYTIDFEKYSSSSDPRGIIEFDPEESLSINLREKGLLGKNASSNLIPFVSHIDTTGFLNPERPIIFPLDTLNLSPQDSTEAKWEFVTGTSFSSSPGCRTRTGLVVEDPYAYHVETNGSVLRLDSRRIDPNKWLIQAPFEGRDWISVGKKENFLYATLGYESAHEPFIWSYNFSTETWGKFVEIPGFTNWDFKSEIVIIGDFLYVIPLVPISSPYAKLYRFDLSEQTWETVALDSFWSGVPPSQALASVIEYEGRIYLNYFKEGFYELNLETRNASFYASFPLDYQEVYGAYMDESGFTTVTASESLPSVIFWEWNPGKQDWSNKGIVPLPYVPINTPTAFSSIKQVPYGERGRLFVYGPNSICKWFLFRKNDN